MNDFVLGLFEEDVDLGGSRFLNQLSNAGTVRLLHNRIWSFWNFEVHVLLNSFTICLIVGVERFDLMIYFRVVFVLQRCASSGCPDLSEEQSSSLKKKFTLFS